MPIGVSGLLSAKLVEGVTLETYPGGSQGLAATGEYNADRLAFIKG